MGVKTNAKCFFTTSWILHFKIVEKFCELGLTLFKQFKNILWKLINESLTFEQSYIPKPLYTVYDPFLLLFLSLFFLPVILGHRWITIVLHKSLRDNINSELNYLLFLLDTKRFYLSFLRVFVFGHYYWYIYEKCLVSRIGDGNCKYRASSDAASSSIKHSGHWCREQAMAYLTEMLILLHHTNCSSNSKLKKTKKINTIFKILFWG